MAESLQFSIGADTKGFQDGIGSILTGLAGLAAAFVSVQAVVNAFSDAIEMGGRLHDLSTRTGETAGNLAILERAFDNTGVGAEKVGAAINKMQDNIISASKEGSAAAEAFKHLGLSFDDLQGKSPSDQLALIGQRLSGIADPATRAQVAIDIFGKAGGELIPILMNFGQEVETAKMQLGSLPNLLDKSADSVDSLGDNIFAIRNKLTELAYGFLSEVSPAIEAFTSKLSGVDAASIGAGLADALVGAFVNPMQAADLLSQTLILGVKTMGNEMVFQVQYWSDIILRTFSAISDDIIPMLGNNMTGAFAMAAGTLGNALADLLKPLEDILGLDFINELKTSSQDLMVQGAAKIAESANIFAVAWETAKKHSEVIKQDIFGVEGSSAKIAEDFAKLQASAKAAMDEFTRSSFSATGGAIAEFGSGSVFGENKVNLLPGQTSIVGGDVPDSILFSETQAQLARMAAPGPSSFSGKGKTDSQLQAELNKRLGLIAGATSTQAIGQSASAIRAQDIQKEMDTMRALGKTETPEFAALGKSLQTNLDIAFGNQLTSSDRDRAHQLAVEDFFKGSTKGISELETQYEKQILEEKRANDPALVKEQMDKAKEAGAGGKPATDKPVTMQSIVNSVLQILQKIEPKIPQHIMS